MKTLADLKRAMQIGTTWRGVNHYYGIELGNRPITKANSVGVYFETTRSDGKTFDSFMEWPKANYVEFGDDGEVKIFTTWQDNPRFHLLSYWKV